MGILKNNFSNSKEDKRQLIEIILLVLIILTVILTLYSSFDRHAGGIQIKDPKLTKEKIYKQGVGKSTVAREVVELDVE
ncbi:MAG: hypothetical protein WGN25_06780 [Candidatus Electrothrix sp. GW3-4]|uniref:hypothetical protein n=1 Tax=Candidatus Electrothrix sp. GW3-4 TaxID=3126740 RepID=UPI0030CE81F9